jgi:eukaryotic-like serine/threonine-protein kinase
MALTSGTKLGPYEVQSPLGAGGMGEVYRARDTRLERTVAVKILPAHLSSNPEARQRFEREARAISSLNHPNICTLYDVGHQDGTDFLVMEFLEGETLADRLMKGPLPPEQVLKYGIEICEGLEKAHKCGVIHRDLKPGNIMLTKSGAKLMDFGLAKATPAHAPPASSLTMTLSGPSADQPLTAQGMVLGTFQYMSPEQVEGKEADARSDLFALGAVLYEMASGRRAFIGKSQASIVAAILAFDPQPISAVQPMSPPALDRVVRTCMAKDPDERWQTAHDVKLQLCWIAEGGSQAGVPAPLAARRRLSQNVAWTAAGVCLLAALALAGIMWLRAPRPSLPLRASLLPPKNSSFDPYGFAISPDGKRLAFVAIAAEKSESTLWVRQLNSVAAQELSGTDGATYPFWSADSTAIGFFAGNKLKKIDAAGGPVIALADVEDGRGGSWGPDGTIVFSRKPQEEGLYQVSSAGGPASEVTHYNKERKEDSHRWPWMLPDGRHFLFYMSSTTLTATNSDQDPVAGLYFYDRKTGRQIRLMPSDSAAQYANGYLFYLRQQNLMAQPFDPRFGTLSGPPVPVAEAVEYNPDRWIGALTVSSSGVLGYLSGAGKQSQLAWYGRDGKEQGKLGGPGSYDVVSISPDGQRVATDLGQPNGPSRDIWIYELARSTATRLTFEGAQAQGPVWTHDGKAIAYTTNRHGGDIYAKASSGLGGEVVVAESNDFKIPNDWTPDGRLLVYMNFTGGKGPRLWVHQTAPEKKDYPLLSTNFAEEDAQFSPDGRWLGYVSEETGKDEIFVVPFPSLSSKWQVSTAGGEQLTWRRDGKELFYVAPNRKLMAVAVDAVGGTFKAGLPRELFTTLIPSAHHVFPQYSATSDGQRFIINTRLEQSLEPITLYANWERELKK